MQILPALARIRQVPFFVWIILANAFLLVNASAIAQPGEVERFQTILIIYLLLTIAFYSMAPRVKGLQMNLNQAILWYVGAFVAGMFIMTGFQAIRGLEIQTYAVDAAVFLIITHTLTISFFEELIFRGFLVSLVTVIPAQIAFGLFHYSAYGGGMMAIFVAIIAGFVFYAIVRYTNIWAAAGFHAAYNISVLGVMGVL